VSSETRFTGSIPEIYDRHMGPVLFEPYALDLAERLPSTAMQVLEVAAGTGRGTRHLLRKLGAGGRIVATDLNPPMLERAAAVVTDARVTWQPADAQQLPFADGAFDAVACQFGLMFVPDKPRALREMHRVLAPGGVLLVTVWDALAKNPMSERLHHLALALMPENPPAFMGLPFSMPDASVLRDLAVAAGFADAQVETVAKVGVAESAEHVAFGLVRGNPLWNQLVERGLDADSFQKSVADALRREFGDAPCRSALSAHVLTARR
jgi:ubiquinone/menaquinone biosynthesis C-methylase UbiE